MKQVHYTNDHVAEVIKAEIARQGGLDEYGQIKIDFAGVCSISDTEQVAKEMGFTAVQDENCGEGEWWLIREDM